jgi:hypothetical protein
MGAKSSLPYSMHASGLWIGTEHQGDDVQQLALEGSVVSGGTARSPHHSPILCSCLVAGCEDVGDKVPCKLRRDRGGGAEHVLLKCRGRDVLTGVHAQDPIIHNSMNCNLLSSCS